MTIPKRETLEGTIDPLPAIATIVESAGEALKAMEQLHPDVLLCDIQMPGTDGYDLLRRLRSLRPERGGDTPAAALIAHDGPEDRRKPSPGSRQPKHLATQFSRAARVSAALLSSANCPNLYRSASPTCARTG